MVRTAGWRQMRSSAGADVCIGPGAGDRASMREHGRAPVLGYPTYTLYTLYDHDILLLVVCPQPLRVAHARRPISLLISPTINPAARPTGQGRSSWRRRAPPRMAASAPNDLEAFFMPFTANRAFKARPRLIARAKDMHYYTPEGRPILDGAAGLWCTNAGHNRDPIVEAIQKQAAELDFAPTFQFGHPRAFELASRIAALAPGDLDHVFFCNSGSEAADTALKIALAYWVAQGPGPAHALHRPRARLSRRRLRRHGGRRARQQPQGVRRDAAGRRPPAAHLQSRAAGVLQGRAGMGRASRRRARAHRRAARRHHHRRRHRRADGGLDRACCRRRRAICSGCARSATSTASC